MILAGGASRRFGTDKTFADWKGRPFLRWVAEAALTQCKDLLILGRSDVATSRYHAVVPEARVRVDVKYQSGPVVALREVLDQIRADWVLVLPCDAPAVNADDVEKLVDAARAAKSVAIAVSGEDRLFDLFCIPRSLLDERLRTARRLEDIVAEAREVQLEAREGLNVNEPLGPSPEASP